jgi:2-hydroxycyclohexanecarboxyl-CoA dehydrogenase
MIDYGFKDKVAIVTGAGGRNFGYNISRLLAQEGANVVANDVIREVADKIAAELTALGPKAIATYADVSSYEACEEMARRAKEEFGRIDILIAIPFWYPMKRFIEETPEEWHKTVDITFFGVINAVKAVLPAMIEQGKGSIVAIGSDSSRVGETSMVVYGAAKAGLVAFARGITREHSRHGVRMNIVNAGATPPLDDSGKSMFPPEYEQKIVKFYPLGRLGRWEDVVNAIAFLASDRASFITGQLLPVSGGYQCI